MRNLSNILLISSLLSACQDNQNVNTSYVSPAQYQGYNCEQIAKEMQRISKRLEESSKQDVTNKVMDSAVAIFSISQGYGYSDDDQNPESARLKSSYDALEQVSIQKNCK